MFYGHDDFCLLLKVLYFKIIEKNPLMSNTKNVDRPTILELPVLPALAHHGLACPPTQDQRLPSP